MNTETRVERFLKAAKNTLGVPVAGFLYRVAKNLESSSQDYESVIKVDLEEQGWAESGDIANYKYESRMSLIFAISSALLGFAEASPYALSLAGIATGNVPLTILPWAVKASGEYLFGQIQRFCADPYNVNLEKVQDAAEVGAK